MFFQGLPTRLPFPGYPGLVRRVWRTKVYADKLSNFQAVIGVPTGRGGWGVSATYLGSGEYNESQVGIGLRYAAGAG